MKNALQKLAKDLKYKSINALCRDNGVDRQYVFQVWGRIPRISSIQKLAPLFKIDEASLYQIFLREHIKRFPQQARARTKKRLALLKIKLINSSDTR